MTDHSIQPADLTQQLLLQLMNEVGALGTKLGDVAGQNTLILQEQKRAADSRQVVYDKLNRFEVAAAEVARLTPLVNKLDEHHNQTVGAIGFGRFLWPMLVAAGTSIATLLGIKFTGH
jgi:hypothetical protein